MKTKEYKRKGWLNNMWGVELFKKKMWGVERFKIEKEKTQQNLGKKRVHIHFEKTKGSLKMT